MDQETIVKYIRLVACAGAISVVSYMAGRSSAPQKKIDITKTDEFTQAVDAKVAEVRTALEIEYSKKTKKTTTKRPDGTVTETVSTSDSGKKTQTKVETKIEYRDRIVEKVVEKTVYVESKPRYAPGAFFEPLPALKNDWVVGVSMDYRLMSGLFLTSSFSTKTTEWQPRLTLGVKWEF